jgi:hypothetical protein
MPNFQYWPVAGQYYLLAKGKWRRLLLFTNILICQNIKVVFHLEPN